MRKERKWNERTRASREDGAYWAYGYNERGEVVSGKKHLPDGTPLAGQQFEYEFDGLGNRLSAKSGGDQNGQGLRSITYTPNALNQYEEIDTPGSFDVIGRAPAGEVTVNSAPALRQGARFRAEVSADNSTCSVWQQVTVAPPQGQPVEGHRYLPKQEVHPLHDDDGNLTFDGRWDYVWDAENRLISMTTNLAAQAVGEPFRKLVFEYDWLGRRLRKRVFDSPSATDPIEDLRFAYDGWNMVAEYSADGSSLTLLRAYLWGTDISGTPQGAGGVGGLLSARAGGAEYAASYDGNGNIIGWIDASGNLACRQEHDPFGNLIAREGGVEIPVGFSTKYRDRETGLIYYIFRYYDPVTGRWRSRDPIGERGGMNLYEFVRNDSMNGTDYLGQLSLNVKLLNFYLLRMVARDPRAVGILAFVPDLIPQTISLFDEDDELPRDFNDDWHFAYRRAAEENVKTPGKWTDFNFRELISVKRYSKRALWETPTVWMLNRVDADKIWFMFNSQVCFEDLAEGRKYYHRRLKGAGCLEERTDARSLSEFIADAKAGNGNMEPGNWVEVFADSYAENPDWWTEAEFTARVGFRFTGPEDDWWWRSH